MHTPAKLTTRNRRQVQQADNNERAVVHSLDLTAQDFQWLQEEDSSLEAVRAAADGGVSTAGQGFFKRDGLMYRQWTPPGRGEKLEMDQLIVPKNAEQWCYSWHTKSP